MKKFFQFNSLFRKKPSDIQYVKKPLLQNQRDWSILLNVSAVVLVALALFSYQTFTTLSKLSNKVFEVSSYVPHYQGSLIDEQIAEFDARAAILTRLRGEVSTVPTTALEATTTPVIDSEVVLDELPTSLTPSQEFSTE